MWLYHCLPALWFWINSVHSGRRRPVEMARQQMQIYYEGRVQGVGFRYTTTSVARGFEVTGTVRNLPDGRVELVAEGERSELDVFRQAIQDAGLAGLIRHEDVSWGEARGE